MEYTTSNGRVIPEHEIRLWISTIIITLKQSGDAIVPFWGNDFLEWYLDKEIIKQQKSDLFKIKLHQDITEDELEQLEQFVNFLRL